MKDKFKPWQRWVLFALAMAVIFASGVIISFLMEHSAEVVNIDYKKKIKINGIEARSIIFAENYPREYKTWVDTTSTDLHSRLNGRTSIDVLAQRPEMVILWAGYAFLRIIQHRAGICTLYRILFIHFVLVRLWGLLTVLNLQVAGCVKVLMFPV